MQDACDLTQRSAALFETTKQDASHIVSIGETLLGRKRMLGQKAKK